MSVSANLLGVGETKNEVMESGAEKPGRLITIDTAVLFNVPKSVVMALLQILVLLQNIPLLFKVKLKQYTFYLDVLRLPFNPKLKHRKQHLFCIGQCVHKVSLWMSLNLRLKSVEPKNRVVQGYFQKPTKKSDRWERCIFFLRRVNSLRGLFILTTVRRNYKNRANW